MAIDFGQITQTISKGGATTLKTVIIAMIVIVVLGVVFGLIAWWRWSKNRYNLKVEIKMPRSNGKITLAEWGKGSFNAKKGVVFIKRAKMRAVPMKVLDIRRYLQGADVLSVIQLGAEDYRPILNDSWAEHTITLIDDEGKEEEVKESILNIRVDTGEYKAWKSAWDSSAKNAYSLKSFLQQFQTPISIAIVLVACFVGFAIVWARMPSVCG